jgi:hypothetical protein
MPAGINKFCKLRSKLGAEGTEIRLLPIATGRAAVLPSAAAHAAASESIHYRLRLYSTGGFGRFTFTQCRHKLLCMVGVSPYILKCVFSLSGGT